MRVLFVTQQIDYEPQGIMHLSSALKAAGHQVELARAYLKDLQTAYEQYQRDGDVEELLSAVQTLEVGVPQTDQAARLDRALEAEDLHLVCWEYIWS